MKNISRTVIYNLIVIIIFFIIYSTISDHFIRPDKKKPVTMDLLNLAITYQVSVGNALITPTTSISIFMVTMQQFFLVFGNLVILHI